MCILVYESWEHSILKIENIDLVAPQWHSLNIDSSKSHWEFTTPGEDGEIV